MPDPGRLIPVYDGTGAEHMAIDSWLLDQHVKGEQPSCLRFYTWRSPTISLGYHQRQFPGFWNTLQWQGQPIDIVRRPTGGRAVLHQGDLTYALITSGLSGSRREIYRQLCQFLINGWQRLGVELTLGAAGRGYIRNPNCFGTATAADLVMNDGYKLIGSAQVYRNGCVLQHGSMRLRPDSELFERVFSEKIAPPDMPKSALTAKGMNEIVTVLAQALQEIWGIAFAMQPLSATEIHCASTGHLPKLERLSD